MLSREQAQALVEQILSIPGIAAMHDGQFGEVALLYPGARVPGLRHAGDGLEVHVVVKHGAGDLVQLADVVRSVSHAATKLGTDVVIGDME